MASQDRVRRLVRLIELLGSGRVCPAHELASLCGVSRRTIFRDLGTLRESGLPVRFDEARRGFRLDRPSFLRSTDFTTPEVLSLLVLCEGLGDDETGIPFQTAARSAAVKLLSTLSPTLREYVGEAIERVDVRLGAINPLDDARPIYDLLTQALRERRQVRIRYGSLTEWQEIMTLLSPYRLLFHTRSWYVVGRSSVHKAVRTFNLGRVRHAELLDSQYVVPPRFSLDRHLGDAWGLIREKDDRHEVVVRFRPMVAHNVAEVQWHRTQRLTWNDDGTLDFSATVDGLREIVWWVLGYGREAEVLHPAKLRSMLRRHADDMCVIYGGDPPEA